MADLHMTQIIRKSLLDDSACLVVVVVIVLVQIVTALKSEALPALKPTFIIF